MHSHSMFKNVCHMEEMVPRHKGHNTIIIEGTRYFTAPSTNLINRWSSTYSHPLGSESWYLLNANVV